MVFTLFILTFLSASLVCHPGCDGWGGGGIRALQKLALMMLWPLSVLLLGKGLSQICQVPQDLRPYLPPGHTEAFPLFICVSCSLHSPLPPDFLTPRWYPETGLWSFSICPG